MANSRKGQINKNIARVLVYGTFADKMGFSEAQDFFDDGSMDEVVSAAEHLDEPENIIEYARKKVHTLLDLGMQNSISYTAEELMAEEDAGLGPLYH